MPRLLGKTYASQMQRDTVRREMLASPELRKWTDGGCKISHPTHIISLGQAEEPERHVRFRCKKTGLLHGLIGYQSDYLAKSVRIRLVVTHPDSTITAPEMYKVLVFDHYTIISDQKMSMGGVWIYQKLMHDSDVTLSLQSGRSLDYGDFLRNFGDKGTPVGDDRFVTTLSPLASLRHGP